MKGLENDLLWKEQLETKILVDESRKLQRSELEEKRESAHTPRSKERYLCLNCIAIPQKVKA